MRRFSLIAALLAAACGARESTFEIARGEPLPAERAAAAAAEDPACVDVQPFFWEIGDGDGPLASGQAGGERFARDERMLVASATKWVFAAYVAERFQGAFTPVTADALRMLSGVVGNKALACRDAGTVAECMAEIGAEYDAAADGRFYYNNGHYLQWGVANGLADLSTADLADELARYLGPAVPLRWSSPQLAGGLYMSPAAYAAFLRNLLTGAYVLSGMLGSDAVCTDPATCDAAIYSPAPRPWRYSYGHWVEDDEDGDGALSSAGLFGFYPWINRERTHYGLLARFSLDPRASVASALCGERIRRAYFEPAAPSAE